MRSYWWSWWVAWVFVCVPAGAAAGWGYVEFLPEFPVGGYDGGFAGDLILFGGMMSLAQAPFVGMFVWVVNPDRNARAAVIGFCTAVLWVVVGFAGWTLGSIVEISWSNPSPGFGLTGVPGRTIRWLVMSALQGVVLACACLPAPRNARDRGGTRSPLPFFGVMSGWIAASAAGGFLFELWAELDPAYGGGSRFGVGSFISDVSRDIGAAPNIADYVVPYAVMLPVLYGLFTGAVISFASKSFVYSPSRTSP